MYKMKVSKSWLFSTDLANSGLLNVMSFSILYQEYAQVYQTQQPEDSNCGETNPVVNSIPLLLR